MRVVFRNTKGRFTNAFDIEARNKYGLLKRWPIYEPVKLIHGDVNEISEIRITCKRNRRT